MRVRYLLLILLLFPITAFSGETNLLEPSKAFMLSARLADADTVEVHYQIAPGYYLYRNRFRFETQDKDVALASPRFPQGKLKNDPIFGEVETYSGELTIAIAVTRLKPLSQFDLKAVSQGCADVGVCYPPQEQIVQVSFSGSAGKNSYSGSTTLALLTQEDSSSASATTLIADEPQASGNSQQSEDNRLARLLIESGFWVALASFFGFGVALAFTPCVYPMIPILSGIIVGQGHRVSKLQGFGLSLAYVLGMAITYALVGVAAGLTGSLFTGALQNPWVLGGFAAVMVLLAFAMFGFYELQLPTFIQSKVSDASNRFRGGHLAGVFAMGALSAVIIGPCVAPPLAAALLVISQTHDIVLGGSALFAMALGMGVPLLVVGVSAGTLLPKTGAWMQAVKCFFGAVLLGVAIWLISPVIPVLVHMLLWTALLIISAIYLHAIDPLPPGAPGLRKFWKGVGVILLLMGIALLIGALSGSRDVLQPLSGFRQVSAKNIQQSLDFERVSSLEQFEQRLKAVNGTSVMLDFYADWCVSCKEMERFTFNDPRVQARLRNTVKLRFDVTKSSDLGRAFLKRFNLFGPPGIIFFDKNGTEIKSLRIIGYQSAEQFLASLGTVL